MIFREKHTRAAERALEAVKQSPLAIRVAMTIASAGSLLAACTTANAVSGQVISSVAAPAAFSMPGSALNSVSCGSPTACVAVGSSGEILFSGDEGKTWQRSAEDANGQLTSVSCANSQSCIAVGSQGLAISSTDGGVHWSAKDSGGSSDLTSISCATPQSCTAVGSGGSAISTDDAGAHWKVINLPGVRQGDMLTSVSCGAPSDCVIVGGSLNHYWAASGRAWHEFPFKGSDSLVSVSCARPGGRCVGVGSNGSVLYSSDSAVTWQNSVQVAPRGSDFVTCPIQVRCYISGAKAPKFGSNLILGTSNYGENWALEDAGTTETIRSMSCGLPWTCSLVGDAETTLTTPDGGQSFVFSASAAPKPSPLNAMVVGDSVSVTLAMGLYDVGKEYGFNITNDGIIGCGIASGGGIRFQTFVQPTPQQLPGPCNGLPTSEQWQQMYQKDVSTVNPQIAILLAGRWETVDRIYNGHWTNILDPAYAAYVASQLDTAVNILSAKGAKVVLLTAPDIGALPPPSSGGDWPEDNPARTQKYNSLLYAEAAKHPGIVSVVDMNTPLDPTGSFDLYINGLRVRTPDGIHMSYGGDEWLAPWLLPAIRNSAGL